MPDAATELSILLTIKDTVSAGLKKTEGAVDSFAGKLQNKLSAGFKQLADVSKVAIAGIVAGGIALGKSAVDAASDYEESLNKVQVVFRDSAKEIEAFSKGAAQNLGLSQQAALEAAGTFGNLFTAMRIGRPEATEMSKGILQLAADLASFNNIKPEEALEKLRAGLVGETEPLRTLGVNLSAAAIESRALTLGLAKTKDELTPAMKAQAAYNLILEQTKSAQGDFARTSDGMANKTRILQASFADLKVEIGQQLKPIVDSVITALVNKVRDPAFQEGVKRWTERIAEFIENVRRGFSQVVIPSFNWILDHQLALKAAGLTIAAGFAWAFPGGALIVGLTAALGLLGKVGQASDLQQLEKRRDQLKDQIADLQKAADKKPSAFDRFTEKVSGGMYVAGNSAVAPLREAQAQLSELNKQIIDLYQQAGAATVVVESTNTAVDDFVPIVDSVGKAAEGAKEKIFTLADALEDKFITMAEAFELHLSPAEAGAIEAANDLAQARYDEAESAFNLTKMLSKLQATFAESTSAGLTLARTIAQETLEKLKSAAASLFQNPTREQADLQLQLSQVDLAMSGFKAGGATDEALDQFKRLRDGLQTQLEFELARTNVLKAQVTAADRTLLTQQVQDQAALQLAGDIRDTSSWVQQSTRDFSDLHPEVREATRALAAFRGLIESFSGLGFDQRIAQSVRDTALAGGFAGVLT